ncbi:MAG: hypothetical protein V1649_02035 [Patescibacteria group bacterium]
MTNKTPTILIIFGISGDLAKRYLLPAIEAIAKAKMLPDKFEIVGITRQKNSKLFEMDLGNTEDYEKLNEHLEKIEKNFKEPAQRLFYLAVPPEACKNIVELIGKSSLVKNKENKTKNKLLLEKPFGTDLENARGLVVHIDKYFKSEQVYRIVHYLAKETAKEIISLRNSKSFKNKWDKNFIEKIEIIISEKIGVEGRINFYEQTGAMRDMVQSHLLELVALTLMELSEGNNVENIPYFRYKALKDLNIVCDITKNECVKRAQYEDYRQEVKNPKTIVETFISINLRSSDKRWRGVPITLTTGKKLKEKFTKIKIKYKNKPLHFDFKDKEGSLGAYEQVLLSAINGDHSFFISSEEILETWRILDAVQKTWEKTRDDLKIYKKGSTIEEVMNI